MQNSDVAGYALAEDGTGLASHISSNEDWAKHDMGLTSDLKKEIYEGHYPDGYELEWVSDFDNNAGGNRAMSLNRNSGEEES